MHVFIYSTLSLFHKLVMAGSGDCMKKTENLQTCRKRPGFPQGGLSLKENISGTFLISMTKTPQKQLAEEKGLFGS